MFAFTPIAFMIMRGVVQGISPSMEEAAQTLRASRCNLPTVTLPLMKPGLANAFLVGFIESMADFGNPVVVGGQYSVLSTDIFFAIVGAQYDQGRAASLALILTRSRWRSSSSSAGAAQPAVHHGLGQGRCRPGHAAARHGAPLVPRLALPWLGFTVVVYLFAFAGGFVQTWGATTPTLAHFITAFDLQWGSVRLVVGRHRLELAVHHGEALAIVGAALRRHRPADQPGCWRAQFAGQRAFEFGALLAFAIPAPCWA